MVVGHLDPFRLLAAGPGLGDVDLPSGGIDLDPEASQFATHRIRQLVSNAIDAMSGGKRRKTLTFYPCPKVGIHLHPRHISSPIRLDIRSVACVLLTGRLRNPPEETAGKESVRSRGDGRADVILDTLHKTLVTPPMIRYRRAHGDARRGFRGDPGADRGGRRGLVAPHGGAGIGAARLAVSVRTGAGTRGDGTGACGCGGSALRRVSPGGEQRPFPGGLAEVAVRQEPEQAEGCRRGGEGSPPRGEGRAVFPGGGGAAGEAAFAGR